MKKTKLIGVVLGIILGFMALSFGLKSLGLIQYGFFGAWKEDVRREVFENTQSYVESKRQDLLKYQFEYAKCNTDKERQAIQSMIQMMFANFDDNHIKNYKLRKFLDDMKYNVQPKQDI